MTRKGIMRKMLRKNLLLFWSLMPHYCAIVLGHRHSKAQNNFVAQTSLPIHKTSL